jgi:hypothetical protein
MSLEGPGTGPKHARGILSHSGGPHSAPGSWGKRAADMDKGPPIPTRKRHIAPVYLTPTVPFTAAKSLSES